MSLSERYIPPLPRSAKCSQPEWPSLADNIPESTLALALSVC